MAARVSLRDYQRELAERLRTADAAAMASKLGVQVGAEQWLIDLSDAGEVLPLPAIRALPLTKPWFRGVANVRGNLYSVVDFGAFFGGAPASTGDQSRLVLLSERFRMGTALLIDRSLGLRNQAELRPVQMGGQEPALRQAGGNRAWLRGEFIDASGGRWKELDVPELVQDADFLAVGI
jgi:twitching motility protein PilI